MRIDTEMIPRLALDASGALAWLNQLATPAGPLVIGAPSEHGIHLFEDWGPDLALSTDGRLSDEAIETLHSLPMAARELGFLQVPTTVDIRIEIVDGLLLRFLITSDETWPSLTLATPLTGLATIVVSEVGSSAALRYLMFMVDEVNEVLGALVLAAESILAEHSTDPVLLTRLADSNEPLVRELSLKNRNMPEEGKALSALRELSEHPNRE